jgi:hypothetical protein
VPTLTPTQVKEHFDLAAQGLPEIPGSKILEHRSEGYVSDLSQLKLWFPRREGIVSLLDVRELARSRPVLNKHSLDRIFAYDDELPTEWRDEYLAIGFVGTIYEEHGQPYFLSMHYWHGARHWQYEEEWLEGDRARECHPDLAIALRAA